MTCRVTLYSDSSVISGLQSLIYPSSKVPKALKTHFSAKSDLIRNHLMIHLKLAQCEAIILNPPV